MLKDLSSNCVQGETWVRMVVTGQSFMLHQIRKMVGVVVAIMRGLLPENAISLALEPKRDVVTPIAPDVGLFLDESIFESYNSKWGVNRNECVTLDNYRAQVEAFKVTSWSPGLYLQFSVVPYENPSRNDLAMLYSSSVSWKHVYCTDIYRLYLHLLIS